MTEFQKRAVVFAGAFAVWAAIVWFIAWDTPPSQWGHEGRGFVAFFMLGASGLAASFPGIRGDRHD